MFLRRVDGVAVDLLVEPGALYTLDGARGDQGWRCSAQRAGVAMVPCHIAMISMTRAAHWQASVSTGRMVEDCSQPRRHGSGAPRRGACAAVCRARRVLPVHSEAQRTALDHPWLVHMAGRKPRCPWHSRQRVAALLGIRAKFKRGSFFSKGLGLPSACSWAWMQYPSAAERLRRCRRSTGRATQIYA